MANIDLFNSQGLSSCTDCNVFTVGRCRKTRKTCKFLRTFSNVATPWQSVESGPFKSNRVRQTDTGAFGSGPMGMVGRVNWSHDGSGRVN